MNTLVAVAIAPFGVGEELSAEVAEVVKVIRESGLPNKTYSMFTEIEGEWDEVMKVVKEATYVLAEKGIRTEVILKADIVLASPIPWKLKLKSEYYFVVRGFDNA